MNTVLRGDFSPNDWIELIKVVFGGAATLLGAIAAAYSVIAAQRARRAEESSRTNTLSLATVGTKIDGLLAERDKAKFLEGKVEATIAADQKMEAFVEGQKSVALEHPDTVGGVAGAVAGAVAEVATRDSGVRAAMDKSVAAQERSASALEAKNVEDKKRK